MGETVKQAIKTGDFAGLDPERLEKLGVDVNECLGSEGYTTLHWACQYGRAEVLEHLLRLGVDITLTTSQGWTAAHVCAIRGCTECLKVLCDEGVELDAVDTRGYTCVHLAAIHGKCGVLQGIIDEGVDVSVSDRRGWTAVHHAAFHGRLAILQMLNRLGIDLLVEDHDGNTPTHLAAAEGHLDCLRILIEKGGRQAIGCRNNNGSTPRDLASKFLKEDCEGFLAFIEGSDATQAPQTLSKPMSYESKDYPAHSAASSGKLRLLRKAIEEGVCHVDDRDPSGSTPSHLAAAAGRSTCLQWLVDNGANVSIKNNASQTPLDLARSSSEIECMAILSGSDGQGKEGESVSEPGFKASASGLARAGAKVEQLEKVLGAAKAHYKELGGILREEEEEREREEEVRRKMEELSSQLEFERERREHLEVELDCLRCRLHQSVGQTDHYRSLLMAREGNTHTHCSSVGGNSNGQERKEQVSPFHSLPGAYGKGLHCRRGSAHTSEGGRRELRGVAGSGNAGYRVQQSHKGIPSAGMFVRVDHL